MADMASPRGDLGSTVAYVRRRRKGERVDGRVEARRRDVVVRRAAIADGGERECVGQGPGCALSVLVMSSWPAMMI